MVELEIPILSDANMKIESKPVSIKVVSQKITTTEETGTGG